MKIARWFPILVLLGLSCSAALADSLDPKFKMKGGGGSTGLFALNDPHFNFTVFGGTSPQTFDFINASGHVAVGVNLLVTLLTGTPTLTFACDPASEYFTGCRVTPLEGGQTLISFFGPNTGEGGFGGIPFATDLPNVGSCSDGFQFCSTSTPGADFAVEVLDVNGDLLNLPKTEGFKVQGTLVPEPSTLLLVLTGVVLLIFFKRS